MRNYTLALLCVLTPFLCLCQSYWEGGIHLGATSYQGDLNPNDYPVMDALDLNYGFFIRRQFSPTWGLRLQLQRGVWRGDDAYSEGPTFDRRGYSFSNTISQGILHLEWDPFGKSRFPAGPHKFRPRITPYGAVGAGLLHTNPQTNYAEGDEGQLPELAARDKAEGEDQFQFAVPVTGGIKLDLSYRTTLALEMSVGYAWTDLIDGVSATGNPDARDWITSGGVNLTMRFSPKDSDGDGVVDKEDSCPAIAGNESAAGCPDRDGDGVEDVEDVCPDLAGLMAFSGCPDTDEDGFMDPADGCPTEFGYEETNGCPDRDNDCVADADDRCPDTEGLIELGGCPDTDGDGIADLDDPCPDEAGLLKNGGCPLPDTDCDGIIDSLDMCPTIADTTGFTGCPDLDADGVIDSLDRCPDVAGPPENEGCPELQEEEREVLVDAQRNVRFRTGSADLLASSQEILDKVYDLLEKYPVYYLTLNGYTDSVGSAKINQSLSERRARSCYNYLKEKGVDEARMTFAGFGEEDPIGDNDTAEGRQLNRRVEFDLYLPEAEQETESKTEGQ